MNNSPSNDIPSNEGGCDTSKMVPADPSQQNPNDQQQTQQQNNEQQQNDNTQNNNNDQNNSSNNNNNDKTVDAQTHKPKKSSGKPLAGEQAKLLLTESMKKKKTKREEQQTKQRKEILDKKRQDDESSDNQHDHPVFAAAYEFMHYVMCHDEASDEKERAICTKFAANAKLVLNNFYNTTAEIFEELCNKFGVILADSQIHDLHISFPIHRDSWNDTDQQQISPNFVNNNFEGDADRLELIFDGKKFSTLLIEGLVGFELDCVNTINNTIKCAKTGQMLINYHAPTERLFKTINQWSDEQFKFGASILHHTAHGLPAEHAKKALVELVTFKGVECLQELSDSSDLLNEVKKARAVTLELFLKYIATFIEFELYGAGNDANITNILDMRKHSLEVEDPFNPTFDTTYVIEEDGLGTPFLDFYNDHRPVTHVLAPPNNNNNNNSNEDNANANNNTTYAMAALRAGLQQVHNLTIRNKDVIKKIEELGGSNANSCALVNNKISFSTVQFMCNEMDKCAAAEELKEQQQQQQQQQEKVDQDSGKKDNTTAADSSSPKADENKEPSAASASASADNNNNNNKKKQEKNSVIAMEVFENYDGAASMFHGESSTIRAYIRGSKKSIFFKQVDNTTGKLKFYVVMIGTKFEERTNKKTGGNEILPVKIHAIDSNKKATSIITQVGYTADRTNFKLEDQATINAYLQASPAVLNQLIKKHNLAQKPIDEKRIGDKLMSLRINIPANAFNKMLQEDLPKLNFTLQDRLSMTVENGKIENQRATIKLRKGCELKHFFETARALHAKYGATCSIRTGTLRVFFPNITPDSVTVEEIRKEIQTVFFVETDNLCQKVWSAADAWKQNNKQKEMYEGLNEEMIKKQQQQQKEKTKSSKPASPPKFVDDKLARYILAGMVLNTEDWKSVAKAAGATLELTPNPDKAIFRWPDDEQATKYQMGDMIIAASGLTGVVSSCPKKRNINNNNDDGVEQ